MAREEAAPANMTGLVHEAFDRRLAPGERVIAACDSLLGVKSRLFKKSKVAVTDRQLIILSRWWPTDYRLDHSFKLDECVLEEASVGLDSSQTLVVSCGDSRVRLYFPRECNEEASKIRRILSREVVSLVELERRLDAGPTREKDDLGSLEGMLDSDFDS